MRKYIVRMLLVLFPATFSHSGFAQAIDSILAQSDPLLSEKIHIHFDKTTYNKGETVWYKIYLLHNSNDTAAVSKNVYLEWYDADGKMIKHTAAPILISTSQGSFDIPLDYKGQSLYVKAFTRWMLNDDPAFIFQRELFVNTGAPKAAEPPPGKTIVETFPEGGYLVQGLNTRLAFKATNRFGNPVFIRGALVDDTNTVIDSLTVKHDGMGSFYFVPLSGRTYSLNWTDESGNTGSTPVPVTKTEGAQLSIKTLNGKARFQVRRTDNAPENFKKMVLLVHMNQITLYRVSINTAERTTLNSEVPIAELPTGLLQFTLFTSDWIPVAERVVFINNRSHEFEAKVKADKIRMGKREKNILEVSVPDTTFTNMSISITDATVNAPDQHTIFSDIFLTSEIKGKIHNPGYYLSGTDENITADLDLVMLTHGWRRFNWDKIKTSVLPETVHPLESSYMQLHGQVSGVKKIDTSVMLNMIVINKDSSRQFITVPVAKDGSFEYPQVFFDTAKVYFNFNNNPTLTKDAKLQMDNSLMKPVPSVIQPGTGAPFIWNDNVAKQRLDAVLAEQELFRKRMAEATLAEVTVTTRAKSKEQVVNDKYTTGFFARGNNTRVFDLTDETKAVFSRNVLEYLQSKVAGLQIAGSSVSWRGDVPEFFLDEIRTDLEHVLSIPMVNIAMIKTFPPIFMYATGGGRGGAIAVYTKRGGDMKQANDIKGMEHMILAGYSKFKEFYSPDYESSEDQSKPDNRTTLYWSPYVITNKSMQRVKIEFYNNDFTQRFNVVLEGINAAGKMTRVVRTIDAKTKD